MFTKETKMYINALRKLYNDKNIKHYKEGELEFIINIYQFEPTSVNPIPFLYALGDKRYDKRMIKGAYISSLSIHKYSIPSTEKERQVLYWKQI